ncbi:MAG: SpoIIE family protein phosphatase [Mitsuaria chitosanitabida]|uniref:ATP-binding protein n=1 Tax=Roseateles chitosanitabidus TaxID=65048 RepID=UPI001B0BC850|nr:ATP-binding protein [Roseateles chitosanitabidus]MBO9687832.1 SpoIIE family protein phosphatase [Roseateles chitosanitabidus]
MRPDQRFSIDDISQVGEARRAAQALTAELGFHEEAAGRVALAVTELGTNLVRHVGPGRQSALLMGVERRPDGTGLRVISLDQGGGMDLQRCLQDGFSTGGSSGTGLGAVKRMADRFDGHSAAGRGTVLVASFSPRGRIPGSPWPAGEPPVTGRAAFDIGAVSLAAPGETICGDGWGLRREGARWIVGLADGLGHGAAAAEASDRFVALLLGEATDRALASPAAFLEDAHERMRATRGAAGAALALEEGQSSLRFAGAGNIVGRLISGVSDRTLLSQHGTLGLQVRRLQDVVYDWPPHAVLVLHSDGIVSRWSLEDTPGLIQAAPAVIAAWVLRDHLRGRDDACVVVVRRGASTGTARDDAAAGPPVIEGEP